MNLMTVSNQWATRPADQRFTSLLTLQASMKALQDNSVSKVVPNRALKIVPAAHDQMKGITIEGPNGAPVTPTHHSFGQLSTLAKAPAGYLRGLPAPLVADCMNFGLRFSREIEEVGVLLTKSEVEVEPGNIAQYIELRAATGPGYGRVWNREIVDVLVDRFGDGLTGDFRVPGEWKKQVAVTKANTTLYASDRDMFVFLCDETHRIDVQGRRNGEPGSLARGFYVWNSEVGDKTLGIAMFLFDELCQNRIIWGVQQFKEIKIRHTAGAPLRWGEQVQPMLEAYANAAAGPVEQIIKAAQEKKLKDDMDKFLSERFTRNEVVGITNSHMAEEGRPMESLWDVTTGVTAFAKTIEHQDVRVEMEKRGGAILDLAAVLV